MSHIFNPTIDNDIYFNYQDLTDYLKPIHAKNKYLKFSVNTYAHGITAVTSGYVGGIYSPIQNRIYLAPVGQGNQTNWHYINCDTGAIVAYANGITAQASAYYGGVYSPIQNRIYLCPTAQSNYTNWHYIDGYTGTVVAYASGATVLTNGYYGGAYSPTQNRIYFSPNNQSDQTNWHYVDCSTGNIVAYANNSGVTPVTSGYYGAVYSPTQNRIYLIPNGQANQSNWHYINCNTGNVVAYAWGGSALQYAYEGGAYSPIQNRIYLAPRLQSDQNNWHYIDCNTGNVVAYTNPYTATIVSGAYIGAVYSPTSNRIYFIPWAQANQSTWHYIDCNTGNVVAYTNNITAVAGGYVGGTYSPTQNRIYLIPYNQSNQSNWHYIQESSYAEIAPSLMASGIFNKF